MDNGKWKMDNGKWTMGNGKCEFLRPSMDREVGKTAAEDADEDDDDNPREDGEETAPAVGQPVLGGWLCRRPLRMMGPVRVGGMVVVVFFVHNDKIKPAPIKKGIYLRSYGCASV